MSEILLASQITVTKHEDGTTLRVQPCRTVSVVVGYKMYVRVVSPRYAEASCFCLHERMILNRTIKTIQRNFLDSKKQIAVDTGADGTTLRSCRAAAVQPPSTSSLQLYARVAAV